MRAWLAVFGKLGPLLLALWAALPPSALALTASQVYEQVKDSVVVVKAYDQNGKMVGLGSGVMLPSGETNPFLAELFGDIITNYHVVKAGVRYTVGQGKKGMPATLKAGDPKKDLCLLTAPGLTAKPGGLFNAEAELVGITTFYLKDGQSLNFALPVEWIGQVALAKLRELPPGEAPTAPVPGATPQAGWKNRAVALEKAQDWPGMMAWCRRWTQTEPDNDLAWFSLGVAYGKLSRHREAIEAYREALRLKPNFTFAWFKLGLSYGKLGRYREETEAYREALRLKPDFADAWNNLGIAYRKMGRYREAVEAYREALRLKPDSAEAWNNLAIAYAQSGNRSAALEAVKELRRYDPQKAEELFNLIMKP